MNTYEYFIKLFGDITVLDVALWIGALGFMYNVYKKVKDKICARHDAEQAYKSKLEEAYDGVHNKYPEYRQQSLQIQQALNSRMDSMGQVLNDMMQKLANMQEITDRRERNRIRDRLLQAYRYYTNPESNPHQCWNNMEAEAFWEMFKDYEDAGGNGFMHSVVVPAMEKLTVVDVIDH